MTYYIVIRNFPGYLPEAEPVVISDDHAPCGVLEYIRDEVEHAMPEPVFESEDSTNFDEQSDAWDKCYAEVAQDVERASDFDAEGGFMYSMPDGYVITAESHTREGLIGLGYVEGEDF